MKETKTSVVKLFKDIRDKSKFGPIEINIPEGIDYKSGLSAIEDIKKMRNIESVSNLITSVFNTTLYSFTVYPKPCKELLDLVKYLNKYKFSGLTTEKFINLASFWIEGKRSTIFTKTPSYLKYNSKLCKEILDWIKDNKRSGYLIKLRSETVRDDSNRYNGRGEDMEIEWTGSDDTYLSIEIMTPGGKIKTTKTFYIS